MYSAVKPHCNVAVKVQKTASWNRNNFLRFNYKQINADWNLGILRLKELLRITV